MIPQAVVLVFTAGFTAALAEGTIGSGARLGRRTGMLLL